MIIGIVPTMRLACGRRPDLWSNAAKNPSLVGLTRTKHFGIQHLYQYPAGTFMPKRLDRIENCKKCKQ